MFRVKKLVLATIGAVAAASVVCFRWQSPTNPRAVNRGATEDPSQDAWAFQRSERIVEGFVLKAFAYLLARWNSHGFYLGGVGMRLLLTIGVILPSQKRSHGTGFRSAATPGNV